MKKVFAMVMCLAIILCFSACNTSGTGVGVTTSSDTTAGETSLLSQESTGTSTTSSKKTTTTTKRSSKTTKRSSTTYVKNSTSKTTTSRVTTTTSQATTSIATSSSTQTVPTVSTTQTTPEKVVPYTDIACAQVTDFLETTFTMENSNILFHIILPEEWGLADSDSGYYIVKDEKIIGHITASENAYSPNESVNVFHRQITSENVTITHSIDRVDSSSYTRTLCYNGDDNFNKYKKLILTVNYEELDASAVYEMITDVEKDKLFTEKNMGVMKINDSRKRVLILGNSFIRTSDIGNILQTMCASDGITVDARSVGGVTSQYFSSDPYLMQEIRTGNFSAVFVCGFFGYNDVAQFLNFVDACEASNTKLAIFPAHNETRCEVDIAAAMYPDIPLIDWKTEINAFIDSGVDYLDFCVPDSHKHSTPLAGYVGAHMIYRAILNRMPTATDFRSVSPWEIDLLGDYPTTGQAPLFDQENAFILP